MPQLPPDAPTRFDFLLLFMGVSLLVGLAVGALAAVPMRVAGSAGSLLAGAALVDGLVRNPPGE